MVTNLAVLMLINNVISPLTFLPCIIIELFIFIETNLLILHLVHTLSSLSLLSSAVNLSISKFSAIA